MDYSGLMTLWWLIIIIISFVYYCLFFIFPRTKQADKHCYLFNFISSLLYRIFLSDVAWCHLHWFSVFYLVEH